MNGTLSTTSIITGRDRWDHFLARCGIRRMHHRIQPGLYTLGSPDKDSYVFVTGNYTLSFDALRAALAVRMHIYWYWIPKASMYGVPPARALLGQMSWFPK